jgi:hypothetical protein
LLCRPRGRQLRHSRRLPCVAGNWPRRDAGTRRNAVRKTGQNTNGGFALSLVQFFLYVTGAAFKHVSHYYQCRLHQHVRAMFSAIRTDPAKHVAFRIIRQDIRFLIRKRAVDRSTHVPQKLQARLTSCSASAPASGALKGAAERWRQTNRRATPRPR